MTAGLEESPSPRIVIGFCTGGQIEVEFHESLHATRMQHPELLAVHEIIVVGGPRLYAHRDAIVRQFLELGNQWLLFADADMAWNAEDLARLAAVADRKAAPIVGGLCFGTSRTAGALWPTLGQRDDDGSYCTQLHVPDDELVEVEWTGLAFLLVHRDVLVSMGVAFAERNGQRNLLPWFEDGQVGGEVVECDRVFCMRARALGYPIFVHTGIPIDHKKPAMHNLDLYRATARLQNERELIG